MNKLNTKKIYDLSELTSEERKELFKEIKRVEGNYNHIFHDGEDWLLYSEKTQFKSPTTNAKELFYTLENIQVDCRELSEEQIKQMADVFKKAGFAMGSLYQTETYFHLNDDNQNYCMVGQYFSDKTTITYKKFMELFSRKEENFKKLVEVVNEERTENKFIEEVNKVEIENYNKLTERERINLEFNPESEHKLFKAYKETSNKLNYELDFNFITQLAERMAQNKHKYEPYNWHKLDNIEELKQALFRHVLEVMKGNYEDDNRLFGHLESIALNCMFINYQLNKHIEK